MSSTPQRMKQSSSFAKNLSPSNLGTINEYGSTDTISTTASPVASVATSRTSDSDGTLAGGWNIQRLKRESTTASMMSLGDVYEIETNPLGSDAIPRRRRQSSNDWSQLDARLSDLVPLQKVQDPDTLTVSSFAPTVAAPKKSRGPSSIIAVLFGCCMPHNQAKEARRAASLDSGVTAAKLSDRDVEPLTAGEPHTPGAGSIADEL